MLGDEIRALREAKCWSQGHLADAARVNVRTVQRIEAGEACSFETLMSLAAALDVDLSQLDQRTVHRANSSRGLARRHALAIFCLAPAVVFIALNLLRSIAGVTRPYVALASAGGRIMSFQTFNLVSPPIFIGGAAAALVVTIPTLVRLRSKKEGGGYYVSGIEVKAEWTSLVLAAMAFCAITSLIAYAALEWVFTLIH